MCKVLNRYVFSGLLLAFSAARTNAQTLNVPQIYEPTYVLHWAAVSEAVLKYYYTYTEQEDILDFASGGVVRDNVLYGSNPSCWDCKGVDQILQWFNGAIYTRGTGRLDWSYVLKSINSQRSPIPIRWAPFGYSARTVVIRGAWYDNGVPYVAIMDSYFGPKYLEFVQLAYNGWDQSLELMGPAFKPANYIEKDIPPSRIGLDEKNAAEMRNAGLSQNPNWDGAGSSSEVN